MGFVYKVQGWYILKYHYTTTKVFRIFGKYYGKNTPFQVLHFFFAFVLITNAMA